MVVLVIEVLKVMLSKLVIIVEDIRLFHRTYKVHPQVTEINIYIRGICNG